MDVVLGFFHMTFLPTKCDNVASISNISHARRWRLLAQEQHCSHAKNYSPSSIAHRSTVQIQITLLSCKKKKGFIFERHTHAFLPVGNLVRGDKGNP